MGKFQIGDKVHCIVPGNYFITGVGVECVVISSYPFIVSLLHKATRYTVNEDYFELITPISLDNI